MQYERYLVVVYDRRMNEEYGEIVFAGSKYEALCIVNAELKKWQKITKVEKIFEPEED